MKSAHPPLFFQLASGIAASVLCVSAWAATPANGSVTAAGDTLTWTGGPFTSANADVATCTEGVSCDTFTLNLDINANQTAKLRFRIDWTGDTNDFDLFIYDELGNEIDNSGQFQTESEQTTTSNLLPGTYTVVTNAFSVVNTSYNGEIEVLEVVTGESPPPLDNTIEFRNTIVDFSAGSGEPFINTDNFGDTYVSVPFGFSTTHSLLWKSIDNARSYIALGNPVTRDAVAGLGGGDTHQDFDAENRLYYVDLSAVCVTAAVSTDDGNTFDPLRNNQVTCISQDNPTAAGDDRQWVGAYGDGIAYATWRNLASSNFWMFKTEDGGLNWDTGRQLGTVTQSGPFQTDKTMRTFNGKPAIISYQVFYQGNSVRTYRIADYNDGTPMDIDNLLVAARGKDVSNVFTVMSIDTAGNLYVVWSEDAVEIMMATSTDLGNTWSTPVRVGHKFGTNIMPWVKAGDPGRVAVVWYNSPLKGNPNIPASRWNIYMAQSLNGLDADPDFSTHQANHSLIHTAEICLRGLACNTSVPMGDRSFLEFPSITIDDQGAAVITYNDNTNQPGHPYVMVSRQLTGASLYESVGDLSTVENGSASIDDPVDNTEVSTATLDALGSHELPPVNFDRDETGDAKFPDHGPVIGGNIPALDIRCVTIDLDGDDVVVTMELDDLTLASLAAAPALSGGDGVLFLTQWDYNDDVYWVAAEVRAGVAAYHTGGLAVVSSGTSTKYITYNPNALDSVQIQGSISNGAPGTIEMRLPRSVVGSPSLGDSFFHVTGYAMSQRGPLVPVASGDPGEPGVPNPSSFPIKVDASGGFTQVLGNAPQLDGTVELSVGDDSFASPVQAGSLSGCPASWQSTVDVSGLPGGPNLLCARQVTNGKLPSASSCVTILIPDLDGDGVADASDNCVATANADQADDDGDSVGNVCDNCLLVANADQCNTNAPDADAGDLGDDKIGNVCDADLDNNGIVNSFDLNIMRSNFGAQGENDADITCDGIVNTFDLQQLREKFGSAPGPTGIAP